jgi:ABC-type sugar transport system ATPase subunit
LTIEVHGVRKAYGTSRRADPVTALDDVDLDVAAGELVVVAGASGSGKTTLLRVVAGLEQPDAGTVRLRGREVTSLAPRDRDVAMVFQDHALYPHLSVADNVAFGLRARGVERAALDRTVQEALELLGLGPLRDRRPTELSGGERQRVALARAIVRRPAAFLLDEPLSGLDPALRAEARGELRALQRRIEAPTLYVTHDPVEAMTLGDRVVVLRGGRVEQVGPPQELYDAPRTAFVARLFGTPPANVLPRELLPGPNGAPLSGIRPEHMALGPVDQGRLRGLVVDLELVGADVVVVVDVGGHVVRLTASRATAPRRGDDVGIAFSDADVLGLHP